MTKNNETFVRITNQDIYKKLCLIENRVIITNGKVKTHTKLIYGLYGAIMIIIGWLITVIMPALG